MLAPPLYSAGIRPGVEFVQKRPYVHTIIYYSLEEDKLVKIWQNYAQILKRNVTLTNLPFFSQNFVTFLASAN